MFISKVVLDRNQHENKSNEVNHGTYTVKRYHRTLRRRMQKPCPRRRSQKAVRDQLCRVQHWLLKPQRTPRKFPQRSPGLSGRPRLIFIPPCPSKCLIGRGGYVPASPRLVNYESTDRPGLHSIVFSWRCLKKAERNMIASTLGT